jgi:hypothetical protein
MWTQDAAWGAGCGDPDAPRTDGTYLATRTAGIWDAQRVSPSVGSASLTLDPDPGRWHAVVHPTGDGELRYLTGTDLDQVTDTPIPETAEVSGATIRLDPTNGGLGVVGTTDQGIEVVTTVAP